jgi:hypothetical protein
MNLAVRWLQAVPVPTVSDTVFAQEPAPSCFLPWPRFR